MALPPPTSPLGLSVSRQLAEQFTDRQITSDGMVTGPMVTAMAESFGDIAPVVARDMANAFVGTRLFAEDDPEDKMTITAAIKALRETIASNKAERVARFGAVMLLGTISLGYDPDGSPIDRMQRRGGAYSSAAKNVLVTADVPDFADLVTGFLGTGAEHPRNQVVRQEHFAPAFLDIAEHLEEIQNEIEVAPAAELMERSQNGLSFEDADELSARQLAKLSDKINALPWSDTLISSSELKVNRLVEDGHNVSYVIDATAINRSIARIYDHALESRADLVRRVIATTCRLSGEGRLKTPAVHSDTKPLVPVQYFGTYGDNDRVVRVYVSKVDAELELPTIAIVGVSRTKKNQAKLISIFSGGGNVATRRVE